MNQTFLFVFSIILASEIFEINCFSIGNSGARLAKRSAHVSVGVGVKVPPKFLQRKQFSWNPNAGLQEVFSETLPPPPPPPTLPSEPILLPEGRNANEDINYEPTPEELEIEEPNFGDAGFEYSGDGEFPDEIAESSPRTWEDFEAEINSTNRDESLNEIEEALEELENTDNESESGISGDEELPDETADSDENEDETEVGFGSFGVGGNDENEEEREFENESIENALSSLEKPSLENTVLPDPGPAPEPSSSENINNIDIGETSDLDRLPEVEASGPFPNEPESSPFPESSDLDRLPDFEVSGPFPNEPESEPAPIDRISDAEEEELRLPEAGTPIDLSTNEYYNYENEEPRKRRKRSEIDDLEEFRQESLSLFNSYRQQLDLPLVSLDEELNDGAQTWAEQSLDTGVIESCEECDYIETFAKRKLTSSRRELPTGVAAAEWVMKRWFTNIMNDNNINDGYAKLLKRQKLTKMGLGIAYSKNGKLKELLVVGRFL